MPFKSRILNSVYAATLATATLAGGAVQAFEPFIGEIRTFGFNFCPRGWAAADGQLISISQNQALFSLYGTYYGGDGRTTFGLPDLRGRFAMHQGRSPGLTPREIGQRGGQETVTLTEGQMPMHDHPIVIANANQQGSNGGLAVNPNAETRLVNGGLGPSGDNQPHDNMPPFLVVNTCVALEGIYPSRS